MCDHEFLSACEAHTVTKEIGVALGHITGFSSVGPKLATAGQPSEAQLRGVAAEGFEVVINLGLLDPSYCLPDEAGFAGQLGMEYHHIPVDFQAPQLENLEQFFAVMDAVRGKKVFVHCAANMRASIFVSLYGQTRFGWTAEKANTLIARIWQPNDVWGQFIRRARESF